MIVANISELLLAESWKQLPDGGKLCNCWWVNGLKKFHFWEICLDVPLEAQSEDRGHFRRCVRSRRDVLAGGERGLSWRTLPAVAMVRGRCGPTRNGFFMGL